VNDVERVNRKRPSEAVMVGIRAAVKITTDVRVELSNRKWCGFAVVVREAHLLSQQLP